LLNYPLSYSFCRRKKKYRGRKIVVRKETVFSLGSALFLSTSCPFSDWKIPGVARFATFLFNVLNATNACGKPPP
jgi:hypothetical protein